MSQTSAPISLNLERTFAASIERVFDAWSKAELLAQWFGPDGFTIVETKTDLYIGGQYSILMQAPDGTEIQHYGEYVQIDRPTTLIFTWVLADQSCAGSEGEHINTLVSISLKAISPDETKLILLHEQLPTQAACDGHEFGWLASLASLDTLLINT